METEAHVYALAVAASVLLAFYPFVIVMLAICRDLLHWPAAANAVELALGDVFGPEQRDFIWRNIGYPKGVPHLRLTSMLLLLFTANGIFEPLEVALNKAWGVTKNRSYLKNQLVSLGLIFACGALGLLSLTFSGINSTWLSQTSDTLGAGVVEWLEILFFKLAALPISMAALFLIYWLLPNRKIDWRRAAQVSIVVGLILEALKYINYLIAPSFQHKFHEDYRFFEHSAMLIAVTAIAALVVLGGAHWTANHDQKDPLA